MGPVLNSTDLFFFNGFEDTSEPFEKVSLWTIEGDMIRPSPSIGIQNKLTPGVYTVGFSRDLGFFCRKAKINSDQLYPFRDTLVSSLFEEINKFWDKRELYKDNNLLHKRGILLCGVPGTGKTSVISLLADQVIKKNGVVFKVDSPKELEQYIDFITNSFRHIEPDTPIITIIEDLDRYSEDPEILDFLDGKSNIEHHIVVATSNNTDAIPDALLRPSRIDYIIEVPLPNEDVRLEYFRYKNVPEDKLEELVRKTTDFSLADLKEVYISIFLLDHPLNEAIDKIKKPTKKKNYTRKSVNSSELGI